MDDGRLSELLNHAPIILLGLEPDGTITRADGRSLTHLGLTPDDAVGKSVFDVFTRHPGALSAFRAAAAGEDCVGVFDAEAAVYEIRFSPGAGADGRVTWVVGVATEVTERARKERSYRDHKALLALVNQAHVRFARGVADPQAIFGDLLFGLMTFTGSRFGFLAKASDDGGRVVLKPQVAHDCAWDEATRKAMRAKLAEGLSIPAGATAVGESLRSGEPFAAALADPLGPALPTGPLDDFVAIPVLVDGRTAVVIGLGNGTARDPAALAAEIGPVLTSCAVLAYAVRERRLRHVLAEDCRQMQDVLETRVRERTAQLVASEAWFRTLTEGMPQLVWSSDPDGKCDYLSKQWVEYTGAPETEQLMDGWVDAIHPDDRAMATARWRDAVEGRGEYDLEFRICRHDGMYRWFKTRGVPVRDAAGRTIKWLGTCTDIDDQKRAEGEARRLTAELERRVAARTRELEDTNRLLSAVVATQQEIATAPADLDRVMGVVTERVRLLTGAGGAVVELVEGDEMVYRAASGAAAPFVGLRLRTGSSLSGLCVRTGEMLRCDDAETDPRVDAAACRRTDARSLVVVPLRHGVRVVGVLKITAPVPKAFGDRHVDTLVLMSGLVGAALSRAAEMAAEQALVAERTASLAEMSEARAAAEAASRAKSEFLANMSHEVRTPMAAVVGYVEMLLDPRLGVDDRVRVVKAIRRNGDHLLQLISDVLDLSKIEAGRVEVERVSAPLWRLVSGALSVAGIRAQEKKVELEVAPSGPLPRVITTDPTRLRQILDNLLSNAVKFTDAGKRVELRVRLTAGTSPPALVFEIADQGVGMTRDEIGRLFRPFSQADASTTRRYGGTGLGLSISQRLAALLGGRIEVESTPGAGSTFTATIPLQESDLDDQIDPAGLTVESELRQPPSITCRRLTGRVLLVEDSPDNQAILRYFLEKAGLAVDLAENGRVAVERVRAARYDVVLMDMQMPELDGYAATRRIREDGYSGPVVALTAHAMADDERKCLDAGCTAYLTKPVDAERLLTVLGRHLTAKSWGVRFAELRRPVPAPTPVPDPADLTRNYLRSLPAKVGAVSDALAGGDLKAVAALAHRLRGSAGMYGVADFGQAAGLVEEAVREGQPASRIGALVGELSEHAERLATASV